MIKPNSMAHQFSFSRGYWKKDMAQYNRIAKRRRARKFGNATKKVNRSK